MFSIFFTPNPRIHRQNNPQRIPSELIAIARRISDPTIPTVETAIKILTRAGYVTADESIIQRYVHPLIFAITQTENYDFTVIRESPRRVVEKFITPRYENLMRTGWPDWPVGADKSPKLLTKKIDRERALAELQLIKLKLK